VSVRLWRRRRQLHELDESEAYEHAYGGRRDVKRVTLPPRRPRDRGVLASGELMRRAFLDRLEARDAENGKSSKD
jgi:hypothetical protein